MRDNIDQMTILMASSDAFGILGLFIYFYLFAI